MNIIYNYVLFILFFGLIANSYLFHRPLILNDDLMSVLETSDNNDHSENVEKYDPVSYNNFLEFIQELINEDEKGKAPRMYMQSNLNLPRYLRSID